jgi:hypothetical protein
MEMEMEMEMEMVMVAVAVIAMAVSRRSVTLPLESVPHSRVTNWPAWPEPHASFSRTVSG